jgi:hypothetical protein
LLLLLVGCRQIFGIADPHAMADAFVMQDGPIDDAPTDAPPLPLDAALDCTMQPPAPLDALDESQNAGLTTLRIKGFKINSNGSKYLVASADDSFMVDFQYTWTDTSCANNCIDQVEIGYVPGDRVGCAFDGQVPKGPPISGNPSYTMTAPATLGWTSIRIAIGQALTCGTGTWFEGPPPATEIAGYVCVH